jgi:cytochrome c oxidase subunit 2
MDPKSGDDVIVISPELHLPVGKDVKFLLRAKDVNHQFAVPQFRVKMDMVPGMVTHFWLRPTRTGSFDALCEQLCGVAHFAMRGRVVVDEEPVFREWLAKQPTFSQTAAQVKGDAEAGKALFATCSACHGENAQGNKELGAPKLQAGRARLARERHLRQANDPVRLDARRRHSGAERRRIHRLAARHAPRHQRRRQSGPRPQAVRDLRVVSRR